MAKKQARGVTKLAILDAALALFKQKGANITVQDVANASDVSRQMVYKYFGTRGALFIALARRVDETSAIKDRFYLAMKTPDIRLKVESCLAVLIDYMGEIYLLANNFIRNRLSDADARAAYDDRMVECKSWIRELVILVNDSHVMHLRHSIEDSVILIVSLTSPQLYELWHTEYLWEHDKIRQHIQNIIIQSVFYDF